MGPKDVQKPELNYDLCCFHVVLRNPEKHYSELKMTFKCLLKWEKSNILLPQHEAFQTLLVKGCIRVQQRVQQTVKPGPSEELMNAAQMQHKTRLPYKTSTKAEAKTGHNLGLNYGSTMIQNLK